MFILLLDVCIQKWPGKAGELLKYMSIIREAAGKGMAWSKYDEQFRMRQEVSLKSWGTINADLWMRIMSSCPSPPLISNAPNGSANVCRGFNIGFCKWVGCHASSVVAEHVATE